MAIEEVARYRDALGLTLPAGVPEALLATVTEPLLGIAGRFARTHGPFVAEDLARRYGISVGAARAVLGELVRANRLVAGSFSKAGHAEELVDPELLRLIKRRSLARLRRAVEPVARGLHALL